LVVGHLILFNWYFLGSIGAPSRGLWENTECGDVALRANLVADATHRLPE